MDMDMGLLPPLIAYEESVYQFTRQLVSFMSSCLPYCIYSGSIWGLKKICSRSGTRLLAFAARVPGARGQGVLIH